MDAEKNVGKQIKILNSKFYDFARNTHSGVPKSTNWVCFPYLSQPPNRDKKGKLEHLPAVSQRPRLIVCPSAKTLALKLSKTVGT